jgi:hypothetical protein
MVGVDLDGTVDELDPTTDIPVKKHDRTGDGSHRGWIIPDVPHRNLDLG